MTSGPASRVTADSEPTVLDHASMQVWGERVGMLARRHRLLVALDGPLGAGKTTLVQAACRGAGYQGIVTSPTYALIHRYDLPEAAALYHADLFRIEDASDLLELGWEDLLDGRSAVFVEWAERAGDALPPDRWEIRLAAGPTRHARTVTFTSLGAAPPVPAPSVAASNSALAADAARSAG